MNLGITGHQRLPDPSSWEWVERSIGETLDQISGPLVAVTSLAIGADQLLAQLVLARGGTVRAILPFEDIERTFEKDALLEYRRLVNQSDVEVLPPHDTDEDAYLAAGQRVADLADVMIAVWDGQPAKGKGGTADIVRYSLERNVPLVHINPVTREVHSSR